MDPPANDRRADPANEDDDPAEEDEQVLLQSLPLEMSQHDPCRTMLTRQEQWHALDIKDAIEREPELDNLSDFMYAQLGLVCEDNVADAVERARGLQAFRQEFGILEGDLPMAKRALREAVELFPTAILAFGYSENDGCYYLVQNQARYRTTELTTPRKQKQWFVGGYYLAHVATPDFQSVRKGYLHIAECKDFSFWHKQDFELIQQCFAGLLSVYPFRPSFLHYNTGVAFNTLGTLLKKVLPADAKERVRVGLTLDGDVGLDDVYLVPNPQAAQEKLLAAMEDAIAKRFHNERTFSLADESRICEI